MKNNISFECVKEITRELKKNFKGIQANSYGFCCNSDYDAYHKYINNDDYVCAKLFKGGLNNNYCYDKYREKCVWNIGSSVYYSWTLTSFDIDNIIAVMQKVADKYDNIVIKPIDDSKCIKLTAKENENNA